MLWPFLASAWKSVCGRLEKNLAAVICAGCWRRCDLYRHDADTKTHHRQEMAHHENGKHLIFMVKLPRLEPTIL